MAIFTTLERSAVASTTYGLVVEGPYDVAIYGELIRKVIPSVSTIVSRPAGGKTKLASLLRPLLRDLEHAVHGHPVDKVMVVRDTNGKDARAVEDQMNQRILGQSFTFPRGTQLHAVRRTAETWLLADVSAVNFVARSRGGREVAEVNEDLEEIVDPKGRLRRLLSQAGLPFDPAVCQEIAARIEIEKLRYRCPSFGIFERRVLDC